MKRLLVIIFIAILASGAVAQTRSRKGPAKQTAQAQAAQAQAAQAQAAPPGGNNQVPYTKDDDCGCEAKVPEVLAIVNGTKISIRDIDDPVKAQMQQMQLQVIEARKRELYLQINSRLLEAEAKKHGKTPARLLEEEVVAKVKEPAESEARAFYDENKSQIDTGFDEAKPHIMDYLRSQRQQAEAKKFADRLRVAADVKVIVKEATPPASEAARARVLATINGQAITSADVEDSLRPLIFEVQERTYNLRKEQLDIKINDMLLEREALKRKVTTRALLDAEVVPKVKKVTEDDAKKFYEQNKERISGEYAQLKDQIIEYLTEQERRSAEAAYARQLRGSASVEVFLTAPEAPVFTIATDDQPWKGGEQASVTIVEFTDFQCSACAKAHPVLEGLIKEYGDRVKLVMRDYPLDQHENAFKAAEAAEAAREQGKYWDYAAILFQSQQALGVDKLKEYATQLGLDRKKFDEALESGRLTAKVQRDVQEGMRIGVNSTPTIFVNGQRLRDKSREALKAAIEAALKASAPQPLYNP
jgi:protein-disulfide isomerase